MYNTPHKEHIKRHSHAPALTSVKASSNNSDDEVDMDISDDGSFGGEMMMRQTVMAATALTVTMTLWK